MHDATCTTKISDNNTAGHSRLSLLYKACKCCSISASYLVRLQTSGCCLHICFCQHPLSNISFLVIVSWLESKPGQSVIISKNKSGYYNIQSDKNPGPLHANCRAGYLPFILTVLTMPGQSILPRVSYKSICMCALNAAPEGILSTAENTVTQKCFQLKLTKVNVTIFLVKRPFSEVS